MASNRIPRINDAIQKELSALLRTVKDPRVSEGMLTITHVDTTSALRYARVYVSALNCPDEKGLLNGLKSAAGYLRRELGSRIDLRYTPELQFFVDDSIVRGTQLRETVEFLYENGAKEVHMRSACPPIMYGCKYLNFSRSTSELELIARQIIDEHEGIDGIKYIHEYSNSNTERGKLLRDEICRRLKLTSLEFQSLEGTVQAVGKPECQLCSYCWSGRE